jgi:2-polyprenyl-3-methyl-5-hydroxy-6-metoxy-1,4-benzoquinol methylase
MKSLSFYEYSAKNVQFFDDEASDFLKCGLSMLSGISRTRNILDLGCGDGSILFALYKTGFLKQVDNVVGVDLSETRIKRVRMALPFVRGIVSNALNIEELSYSSFDFIICSQLIEHVDDKLLLIEIKRLLAKRGLVYISTVVKKSYGVYFYFKEGSFRLDPTHVREYHSAKEFIDLLSNEGFDIVAIRNKHVMFPLLDLFLRFFIKYGIIKPNANFYNDHKVQKARKLKIPIIGYSILEVLIKK